MKDFWDELWDFASENALGLPTKLIADIHTIGKNLDKATDYPGTDPHAALTWCCKDVAKRLRMKLPDSLHGRMVMGDQNEYTKEYVRRFGA